MKTFSYSSINIKFSNPTGITSDDLKLFASSYFSLIPETYFFENSFLNEDDSIFFSEKTYNAINLKHPFIMMNRPHSLEKLTELGYKTFHPYIDETYDTLEDPKERWDALVPQILRFAAMSMEEVHNWYYSVQDILIHNHRHFMTLSDFNPLEDFFSTF